MINKGDLIAGRYRILDTLGEGGMANVYLAEDTFLHRKVALKSLRLDLTDNKQFQERFKRESQAMSKLSSPYIVNILDVGDDDFSYIVMEYVDGPSLKKYLRQHYPLDLPEVVSLMEEILQGVIVAHNHGIIHRDLKSQNVLLTPQKHAKVADFGIALALGDQSITQSDTTIGSIHYMAPERVRGAQANQRSDIYALGIILFEMLMGKLPFDGDNAMAVALQHFNDQLPNMRAINPDIPQALENVVRKATAKDLTQRYKSVQEMAQDLKTSLDPARSKESPLPLSALNKPVDNRQTKVLPNLTAEQTVPQSNNSKIKKPFKKWRLWLLLVLLVVLLVGLFWYPRREVTVPDVANLTQAQAQTVLGNSGLKVQQVVGIHDVKVAKGRIIRSAPAEGLHLKKGTKIKLVKSLGPTLKKLPNVQGLNYYDAKKKLQHAGFRVQKKHQYSNQVAAGLVVKQSPSTSKHQKVAQNKIIKLTVSLGQKNYGFVIKDLVGYNLREVQDYANEEGLQLIVKNAPSATVDKGLVIEQNPSPGTTVLRGSQLEVTISLGNKSTPVPNDHSNDTDNNDNLQNVAQTVNIPYNNANSSGNNQVKIYLKDANHSLSNVYQNLTITADTPVTLNFQLNHGQVGQYIIERDGQTIVSQTVTAN
ncbi:Stk1 family PASTA domain-containing Ser/Thr kinase [Bombilactobacillus thymidiniphilus]|uniref:non-specific serine/threonine protein kinase n=1 Tax=Bombilactobacillus thymidiniphilus TaxID=2923363 RepID=A0ABY4PD01_9LACO|nr:Stk1 family PASTA domain-containing Ser/Thr kinase [Bombilactobacillus thymidiniphilus]UQS83460.1 Stk1 family PASTA domain-containing Ser/Thr kinase [Bombilactobacillus thymidiniphilus]